MLLNIGHHGLIRRAKYPVNLCLASKQHASWMTQPPPWVMQTACSFAGAWGGGHKPKAFYVSSYFWDRAAEAGEPAYSTLPACLKSDICLHRVFDCMHACVVVLQECSVRFVSTSAHARLYVRQRTCTMPPRTALCVRQW